MLIYLSFRPSYATHTTVFLLSTSNPIYLFMMVSRTKYYYDFSGKATYRGQPKRLRLRSLFRSMMRLVIESG